VSMTLSDGEFLSWIRGFKRKLFRFETQSHYAFPYEVPEFERFREGNPTLPSEIQWWQEWLNRVTEWTESGKTDYQRWLIWSTEWHDQAGEDIRYLERDTAKQLGIYLNDWWLIDDAVVIEMSFAHDGRMIEKTLTIDPAVVAGYMSWRDLLQRHAISAQDISVVAFG
jgi:hypothetical protein